MTVHSQIDRLAVPKIWDGKAVPFTASFVTASFVRSLGGQESVVTVPIPSHRSHNQPSCT
jgi:hypothetical protein